MQHITAVYVKFIITFFAFQLYIKIMKICISRSLKWINKHDNNSKTTHTQINSIHEFLVYM